MQICRVIFELDWPGFGLPFEIRNTELLRNSSNDRRSFDNHRKISSQT